MKKILLFATAFAFTISAFAQAKPDEVIKVNTEKHDFGKIKAGTPVSYAFEIKNTSDHPIVVENSWASCGCTTPEKIVDPIMPGKTALLKVQYNAAAVSPFTKDVFIKLAGIEQPKTVQITGEVLSAEAYEVYLKEKNSGKQMKSINNDIQSQSSAATKETPVKMKSMPTTQPKLTKAPGNN